MPTYIKSAVRHNFQKKLPLDIYFAVWVPVRTTDLHFGNKFQPKTNKQTTLKFVSSLRQGHDITTWMAN